MKTIFWLAVVFGLFSFFVICIQANEYSKLSDFHKSYVFPDKWPYPVFLACIVIALTV